MAEQKQSRPNNYSPDTVPPAYNSKTKLFSTQSRHVTNIFFPAKGRILFRQALYATHILDNRHEFGPAKETLKLLKPCSKGSRMDCWESLFIHLHHRHNILIDEQQANDNNPLFALASIPCDLTQPAQYSITSHSARYTCLTG